ncbi:IreB family regulatory phosphoprotein [Caldicellulosiruptoraceae bacterium PP1]
MDDKTQKFPIDKDLEKKVVEILSEVYSALKEKGYNPIAQLVGYIISGDPTYITNHKNARSIIRRIERDEILEEIIKYYINNNIEQ